MISAKPNHDIQESDPRVGDVNYHDKKKDKKVQDELEEKVFKEMILSGVKEEYAIHFSFPPGEHYSDNSVEAQLWNLSEEIGYCYFMLEEILSGRLSLQERIKFFLDTSDFLDKFAKVEDKFASVKEILRSELRPKLNKAKDCL